MKFENVFLMLVLIIVLHRLIGFDNIEPETLDKVQWATEFLILCWFVLDWLPSLRSKLKDPRVKEMLQTLTPVLFIAVFASYYLENKGVSINESNQMIATVMIGAAWVAMIIIRRLWIRHLAKKSMEEKQ